MMFEQHIEHCFGEHIVRGPKSSDLTSSLASLEPAMRALAARTDRSSAPLLDITLRSDDLAEIETLAASIRKRFTHVVVAGSGGSGLSGRTLVTSKPISLKPRLYFLETIDPDAIEDVLSQVTLADTCFIFSSKSGSTAETLGQFYALCHILKNTLGEKALAEQCIIITMPAKSPLRESAEAYGMRIIDHDPHIGGRFSLFTPVGLLPAAIAGMDIRALRKGAAQLDRAQRTPAAAAKCRHVGLGAVARGRRHLGQQGEVGVDGHVVLEVQALALGGHRARKAQHRQDECSLHAALTAVG